MNFYQVMRVMKITMLLIICLLTQVSASTYAQRVTLDMQNCAIHNVLEEIRKQTNYDFSYDTELFSNSKKVNIHVKDATIEQVLDKCFANQPYSYEIRNGFVVINKTATSTPLAKIQTDPQQPGRITGKVLDDRGEPLPGASVKIVQTNQSVQSSVDGTYNFGIAEGIYTIEVTYISFQTKRITEVEVKGGQTTSLNIVLNPAVNALSQVTVTGSYKKESLAGLYAAQKNAASVTDGITAEQMARTPDNNAAQSLRRVSGLQVSDEKYVVIRGLSERYNNVLLNGSSLPSSEPNRRNFAFDIVPTGIVDRMVVNKTATPDLTGEFTGGLVQIETKDIPTENFTSLTIGSGYNSISTGRDMIGLDRGKNAWLGMASDVHDKPSGMSFGQYNALAKTVSKTATLPSDPNRQQMHQFLGTMPENWAMRRYTAMPMQNYQLQLGRVYRLSGQRQFGLVAALNYRNDQQLEDRVLHEPSFNDYGGVSNQYQTRLGGALNLAYQFGGHKLKLQNTFNQRFSDNLWKYAGTDYDNNNVYQDSYANVTIVNRMLQSQLGGEHALGRKGVKLDWSGSFASSKRDQPYSRIMSRFRTEVGSMVTPDDYFGIDLSDNRLKNGNLFYSDLRENMYGWSANLQLPFQLLEQKQLLKVGYQGRRRDADFTADLYRTLVFTDGSTNRKYPSGIPYQQVFTGANFGRDLFLYPVSGQGRERDGAESSEGYEGSQDLHAGYAMLDIRLLKKLRAVGGLRVERNDQKVYDYVWNAKEQKGEKKLSRINQTDWLPSLNLTYGLGEKVNLRGAWYKTLARPDFREMSSFAYFDYEMFSTFTGDSLRSTTVNNADLRLEYYPSPGEVISISGFYKKFSNPIEAIMLATSGSSIVYQYQNLQSARDVGFEVDFRKSLGFISQGNKLLSNIFLSGNYTWVNAEVNFYEQSAIDPVTKKALSGTRKRPLAGQSPYIANGGVTYAGERLGLNLTFNRYGRRIVFASPSIALDEYELPRNMMDAQVSYRFLKKKNLELKVNASNLLNQQLRIYRNSIDVENPFGPKAVRASSLPLYYADGSPFPITTEHPEYHDPKGVEYNRDYDTIVRQTKFGTTYSFSFTYHF